MSNFRLLQALPEHVRGICSLAARVYPDTAGWPIEKLQHHQIVFPAGQIVAVEVSTGAVVGASLNLIVDWAKTPFSWTYKDAVGDGWFDNHAPDTGRFLYGAELMVGPENRRYGIGTALLTAQMNLAQAMGLLGARGSIEIPSGTSIEECLAKNIGGFNLRQHLSHPALALQVGVGASFLGVLFDHFDHAQSPSRHALLVERLRPA